MLPYLLSNYKEINLPSLNIFTNLKKLYVLLIGQHNIYKTISPSNMLINRVFFMNPKPLKHMTLLKPYNKKIHIYFPYDESMEGKG